MARPPQPAFPFRLIARRFANRLKHESCEPLIIVLGHANFYPRFGFRRASTHECKWDVPDEVFMLLTLGEQKMRDVSGLAKYCAEFSTVT